MDATSVYNIKFSNIRAGDFEQALRQVAETEQAWREETERQLQQKIDAESPPPPLLTPPLHAPPSPLPHYKTPPSRPTQRVVARQPQVLIGRHNQTAVSS